MIEAGRWLWDVRVPMRDGVVLSVDLHLPPDGLPGGPYPGVLVRTSAGNQNPALVSQARSLADAGFAVALQDVRGREDSDGRFRPFVDEGPDGYDTIEWVAAQDWCSGKVGMMGSGYAGWTQWAAAHEKPPHLTTLVSASPWSPGPGSVPGALSLERLAWLHAMSARVWQEAGPVDWETVLRHVPLREVGSAIGCRLPAWAEWLDDPASWRALELPDDVVDVPVLHVTDWQSAGPVRRASQEAVVIGAADLDALHKDWFTHWLKDPEHAAPASRYFVTGADSWRDEAWVPEESGTSWFLGADGALSPSPGDDGKDSYAYDPVDPVQLTPDLTFFPSAPKPRPALPRDRRFLERRPDVLVYTSQPVTEGLELVGRPSARLFVSSDRRDTDFFVQLSDVTPTGRSLAVASGGLRARSRAGAEREVFLVPGEVAELSIELSAVGHVLLPGHRLRLTVTSSWFPLVDRNLNTGGPVGSETEPLVATNTVHAGSAHPSALVLPVRSPR